MIRVLVKLSLKYLAALLVTTQALGQVTISGKVYCDTGKPLQYINLLIYSKAGHSIIAFGMTDAKGLFKILVDNKADSIKIVASSVHYEKVSYTLPNVDQSVDFKLREDVKLLDTFTLRAKPVEKNGDTISYLVKPFANEIDRSIEDVLRRMPGIEIESNGRILYQGIPIRKFYVEGLDLMDGRYVAISSNLPHESVSTIEILENHQPIQILQDRSTSSQASINLKLKKDITTTGNFTATIGGPNIVWDGRLSPMTFMKKFQTLTSYQTNNIGFDLSNQLHNNVFQNDITLQQHSDYNILEIPEPVQPQIPNNQYLINETHLVNLNGLSRINQSSQIRANLIYFNDFRNNNYRATNQYFLPNDTLIFDEYINNRNYSNIWLFDLDMSKNDKSKFIINKLSLKSSRKNDKGELKQNNEEIIQDLNSYPESVTNLFRIVLPAKKSLIDFTSYLSYDNNRQSLSVQPGSFTEILNENVPYDKAIQHAHIKRYNYSQSLGYLFDYRKLIISPKIGLSGTNQQFYSHTEILDFNKSNTADSGFRNNLRRDQISLFAQSGIEFRGRYYTAKSILPIKFNQYHLSDQGFNLSNNYTHFIFEPELEFSFNPTDFWKIRLFYSLKRSPDDFENHYFGKVLQSFRDIKYNSSEVTKINRHKYSVSISYRNPLTSFFSTFIYTYITNNKFNFLDYYVDDAGSIIQSNKKRLNRSNMHNFFGQSSRYFSDLRSSIGLRIRYTYHSNISSINNSIIKSNNVHIVLEPNFNTRILDIINIEYRLSQNYYSVKRSNTRNNFKSESYHNISLFTLYPKNHTVILNNTIYLPNSRLSYNCDFTYRFSLSRKKVDFEFRWNNIFNATTFQNSYMNDFYSIENQYYLRPTQASITARFSF